MFDMMEFLEMIGFGEWAEKFILNYAPGEVTFSELVFTTLPPMLQLFILVFFLNWIMGLIGDCMGSVRRGGRF